MTHILKRREFLVSQSAVAAGAAVAPWTLWSAPARAVTAPGGERRKLVVILLRGAVDGLSVVVPQAEPYYHEARSTIALGPGDGVIPLDSRFGLHPALARLRPMWDRGQLGFVHASGSPDPTRSHFDAQDYLETGTPGRKSTPDGWMNRLLTQLPGPSAATRAVNLGATPPRILAGAATVATLGLGPRATEAKSIDDPALQSALTRMYGQDSRLARTLQETTQGRGDIQRSLAAADNRAAAGGMGAVGAMGPAGAMDNGRSSDPSADAGAPTARGFAADAQRLGRLIQADPHTQLAFTSVGGWDTHVNQGGARGQLANRLTSLAEGLDGLVQGLGEAFRDTVIVVMSEFGRTVRQNGTGGTDHGRGNVMWLLGGPVAGGRVLGEWPGLDPSALLDGRDLAVTTDFRAVLSPLLQQHLGLDDAALSQVFPGYRGGLIRGNLLR